MLRSKNQAAYVSYLILEQRNIITRGSLEHE